MAQRSLDLLGMGLRNGLSGYTLVLTACQRVQVAHADQGDTIFSAIPGYLEAMRGFAWIRPATLAAPKAGQSNHPCLTYVNSNTRSASGDCATWRQTRRNHRRRHLRCWRKLSRESADSGVGLDNDKEQDRTTNANMRVGKVTPTLTMGHG